MSLEEFYAPIIERMTGNDDRYKANGWGSRRSMERRFKVASDALGIRSGDAVLDWGCGTGELSHWLHAQGIDVIYDGIDAVPDMVHIAQANGVPARLLDPTKSQELLPTSGYDHVVCIGTIGAVAGMEDEKWAALQSLVMTCKKIASKGFAFTLLTDRDGPKFDDGYHWYTEWPVIVPTVLRLLGKDMRVQVLANYHPHDVMFVAHKGSF